MNIIDIHIHGIAGFDTRATNPEDIIRIAEIQSSEGVSAIVPTIYSDSIEIMRQNIMAVKKAMESQKSEEAAGSAGIHGRKRTADILGVHLEGPFLNTAKCGALDSSSFIESNESNLKRLIDGFEDIVKVITIAPELDGAVKLIRMMANMGIRASMGHSEAAYSEAEAGYHAGAKGITHIFNAMRGMHHREPGLAGFGLMNKDVYVEVIADPHHINLRMIDLIFQTKRSDKIILISDSVRETKTEGLSKGCAVMDAAGRLQGGSMSIVESSRRLREAGLDEVIINMCMAENPEKYLY